jgi:hypothetical protein
MGGLRGEGALYKEFLKKVNQKLKGGKLNARLPRTL